MLAYRFLVTGLGVLVILSACDRHSDSDDSTQQWGTRLDLSLDSLAPTAEFSLARSIHLDSLTPPASSLGAAVLLEDGGLLLSDWRQQRVLHLDSYGQVAAVIGGRGEGPGEFRALGAMALLGSDSLIAFDGELGRFSVFDLAGAFGRSFRPYWLSAGMRITLLQPAPGGFVFGAKRAPDSEVMQTLLVRPTRDSVDVGRMDSQGELLEGFGPRVADRLVHVTVTGLSYRVEIVPNGLRALIAATAFGLFISQNTGLNFEFWPWQVLANDRVTLASEVDTFGSPEGYFGTIVPDGLGSAWLTERGSNAQGLRRWYRISASGRIIEVIEMPGDVGLMGARGTTLVAQRETERGETELLIGSVDPLR